MGDRIDRGRRRCRRVSARRLDALYRVRELRRCVETGIPRWRRGPALPNRGVAHEKRGTSRRSAPPISLIRPRLHLAARDAWVSLPSSLSPPEEGAAAAALQEPVLESRQLPPASPSPEAS